MSKSVEFIFDFGSPNAYLANGPLRGICARSGAELVYTPCLLGGIFKATGNQAPMLAFRDVQGKMAYEQLEFRRFVERHGLTRFRWNSAFPVNTILLMRGAIAAQADGRLAEYIDAGLRAMWEDDANMSDPDIYAETMTRAGFDGPGLLARTQEPEIKAALMRNTEDAVARGVFGIPTFFVGEEMFFGKERLGQVEEMLAG